YSPQFRYYLGGLLRIQAILSVVQICLFGLGALACVLIPSLNANTGMLVGLACGCPLLLLFYLLRTASYINLNPRAATNAAILYCVVLLTCIAVLVAYGRLTSGKAFFIMGLSSAMASTLLIGSLKPAWRSGPLSTIGLAREHWTFGRWELSKVGIDWLIENMSYAVTASLFGVSQAGTLKALATLFLPLQQMLTALRRIFLPYLAKIYSHGEGGRMVRAIKRVIVLFGAGTLAYGIGVTVAAPWIRTILYRNNFPELPGLVPCSALALFASVPVLALDMGLRAVRYPKAVFIAATSASIAPVFLGWLAGWTFGMRGVILNGLVTSTILIVSMTRSLKLRLAKGVDTMAAEA
ncbi:MAG TPA: hypothetical protein VHB50_19925, partial [Bryobacteraceae bacterium]|nr:hypothetical protein [Bryobacteraceae bacterium]